MSHVLPYFETSWSLKRATNRKEKLRESSYKTGNGSNATGTEIVTETKGKRFTEEVKLNIFQPRG
jgi:hypothetical protein